jgi:hypothetical protein
MAPQHTNLQTIGCIESTRVSSRQGATIMRRAPHIAHITLGFVLAVLLSLGLAGMALAHGGPGITITPTSAMPGDTVAVTAAAVSSPNGDVTITIIGNGVNTVLPMQKASDDGDFEGNITIPTALIAGSYQVQVTGDKGSLTGDIDISAAAGSDSTSTSTQTTTAMSTPAFEPRERPLIEVIGFVALFGLLAGAGLFFARTARQHPAAQ